MTATVVGCLHPDDKLSRLKSGILRCTGCGADVTELVTPPEVPSQRVVCLPDINPNEVRPAVKLLNVATEHGWTTQLGAAGNVVTLTLSRGDDHGSVSWVRTDEGAWRFQGCKIAGERFGVRAVPERLARVNAPAPAERHLTIVPPPPPDPMWIDPAKLLDPLGVRAVPAPPSAPAPAGGVMPTGTLAAFMSAAPKAEPVRGNTPWGERYADTLRDIIEWHGRNSERSLQIHLGPSELGVPCDRQVAGKFAGLPETNHVVDPWPSILGTAGHAWLDKAFTKENARHGLRWVPENRVTPHPDHAGTADLYDGAEQAVVDWKILSNDKIASIAAKGPSIQYQVQLLLYGLGYRNLGLPVRRVVLAALPRNQATLKGMYVWDHELTPADDDVIEEVWRLTAIRRAWADEILQGKATLMSVPSTPDSETCYFCPFYRPQAAEDGGTGCPGTKQH